MTEPTDKPLLDDQQLDEYLKGDSSVSRQYRQLPREDVPASLDRLVLRQAEDAVKRPSQPAWMRWTKPLAVAASAVLVVSIVVETGLKDETRVTPQMVQAPAEKKMSEESAGAPPPALPKVEAPPPVVYVDPVQSSVPPLADMAIAPSISEPAAAAAPAPTPAPPPELEARIVTRESADASIEEQLAKSEQEDKPAFAADEPRQKSAREEDALAQGQVTAQRNAERAAVLSYSRPISSTAVDNAATLKKTYTDPEAWLKDIRQLRKDNKPEEADREWRRFREAFPDYEVAETDAAREAKR